MVVKIHKKGASFKGAARYLLHDVKAETADRVAWTAVRNIASHNPHVAARVMAYTAIDQERLKAEAGVSKSGRKGKLPVLHFSLSWHPTERPTLNRAEMERAAKTILRVMGASEHQALIVCHSDSTPHVHILTNRVHPKDGRMLSSSFEKLKASQWAEKYEQERGKIFCEQRVINNAARKRQEYTRGKKEMPRHLYDAVKAAGERKELRAQIIERHRRKAAALKAAERQLTDRHAEARKRLEENHKQLIQVIVQKARAVIARNKTQIWERYRPQWERLFHEQQAEQRVFERQEAELIGRAKNAFQAIDFTGMFLRKPGREAGKAATLTEAFQLLGDAGARRQALGARQEASQRELQRQQRRQEREAVRLRKAEEQRYLAEARRRYATERSDLTLRQEMEKAKLNAQWFEKGRQLRHDVRRLRAAKLLRRPLAPKFAEAARGAPSQDRNEGKLPAAKKRPERSRTNPSDIVPQENAPAAARRIDQWEELLAKRFGPTRDFGADRDDERER